MRGFRIEGLDKLRGTLDDAQKNASKRLAGALRVEAERIMTASKLLTPVDQGTLRASGHVQTPKVTRQRATVTLGYGGAASAYALVQHERVDYTHTVGQAKFLEQPVNEARRGFTQRVAKNLDLFR